MKIQVQPDFGIHIRSAGITLADLARASQVSDETLYTYIRLGSSNKPKMVQQLTARKIARAFAQKAGCTPEVAFKMLFREVPQ